MRYVYGRGPSLLTAPLTYTFLLLLAATTTVTFGSWMYLLSPSEMSFSTSRGVRPAT